MLIGAAREGNVSVEMSKDDSLAQDGAVKWAEEMQSAAGTLARQ